MSTFYRISNKPKISRQTIEGITSEMSGGGGSSPSVCILSKSVLASQNVGGSNGTVVWWTWDTEDRKDANYTHNNITNSSRVTVSEAGWYEIVFIGNAMTTGNARTTLQGVYRVNGGTTSRRGTVRSYTRGANYGNLSPQVFVTIQLNAGDYIEVGTRVEDTDSSYVINTIGAEIDNDSHFLQIKKL